jgi:hypothetical protein
MGRLKNKKRKQKLPVAEITYFRHNMDIEEI